MYKTSAGEEEELQRLLTTQSEVESLGVVRLADPVRSTEDRQALAVMKQTTKKLEGEDGYVSGLLPREEIQRKFLVSFELFQIDKRA